VAPGPGAGFWEKEVVVKRLSMFFVLALVLTFAAVPVFAGPVPSKTAANQSIDSRDADLAVVRDVATNDEVAKVLRANGFSQEQVDQRLAQLSPQDLHQLAQNLDQLQAAGLTKQEWIWISIGAIAALVLIIVLTE
jgi:membrane-bound lytic murein transglycosylase B